MFFEKEMKCRCCSGHLKSVEELCIRVCFNFSSFFLFVFHKKSSTKIVMGMGRVIFQTKALSILIQTTLKI